MSNDINKKFRDHVVTILLHDYFHRHVFKKMIGEKQWSRFESRLEKNVDSVCDLLDQFNIKATFFTLGWIAEMQPGIIRKLVSQGHEIASAGYGTRSIQEMTPEQFREDLRRAKRALEHAGANQIVGYRCAYKWMQDTDLWALDILAEEGYLYDASYRPPLWKIKTNPPCRIAHQYQKNAHEIWEFPVSTYHVTGFNIPISGGNYLRQFPQRFILHAFHRWCNDTESPFVLYFHPWELDMEQPRMTFIGATSRIKQYRNLGNIPQLLPVYFRSGHFQSITQYLGIPLQYEEKHSDGIHPHKARAITTSGDEVKHPLEKITIVVPVFNEVSSIPYLAKALDELIVEAENKYEFKFVFVDDGSTDDSYALLSRLFGGRSNFEILRHRKNQGISRTLETGLKAATTDIICSIDADCSYDPLELLKMIPLLDDSTDMVTASPYHYDGHVSYVPKWRLLLSKSLSRIYHIILHHKLSTYTSCFRVYRRSSLSNIYVKYSDYRGIVELLAKLDSHGGIIREYPTTLQSRIFGQSKMQVLNTIIAHLKLLIEILQYRRNLIKK